jgi:CelD/BcsL family acetyltransferase involved in cellulose biosynthesis
MNIAARSSVAGRFLSDPEERVGIGVPKMLLFDTFTAAEPLWRRLERTEPLATPYQRFEWISHWFDHVGRPDGAAALVAAGVDRDGEPLFIIPLIRELRHGCAVARFCGGSHANLNMAIWRGDVAAGLTAAQVAAVLGDVARAREIDLFALVGQPPAWRGIANPFAALPRQASPDDVFCGTFDPAGPRFEPRLPSGMRKKARKLIRLDGFRYLMAQTPDEVDRILAAFWPQKAARFAKQGIHNVFDDAGVKDFIRAACLDGLAERRPVIELHALEGAGETLAIVGGAADHERFSVMFNSITDSDYARMSPGIILMADIIRMCAKRGLTSFDLGAGHAPYKDYFCSSSEQRFDCFIPFSTRGRVLGTAFQACEALRRSLKSTPALMSALQTVRRWTTGGMAKMG